MANLLYRDRSADKKLAASVTLSGTELVSYLGVLMSQGRTSTADQAHMQERSVGSLPTDARRGRRRQQLAGPLHDARPREQPDLGLAATDRPALQRLRGGAGR